MKKKIVILFMLVFSAFVFVGCSLFDGENLQVQVLTLEEQEARIQTIAETYPDSVVTIFTYNTSSNKHISLGSGVVIKDNGFIVTNFHVISDIEFDETDTYQAKVAFNESSLLYDATIEWHNAALDLAIVKVDRIGLDYVPMKDVSIFPEENSHYYASQLVVAIGTPLEFSLQNTVTVGRISSKAHRIAYAEGNVYEDLIQHTAPINHGNSGGGLFDLDGNLIGLNTLGNDEANSLFFAVPIYPIMEVLNQVVEAYSSGKTHRAGLLGITAVDRYQSEMFEIDFDDTGLYVDSVLLDGASFGKLFEGDVIKKVTVNGKQTDVDIRNNFVFALLKTTAGTKITLQVERAIFGLVNVEIELG